MKEIPTQMLPIGLIEPNKGQIEGLPKNPRLIRDEHFKKLKKSIEDNPEMLYLRELLVYPHEGKYITIGGNMRLMAMRDLEYTEAPCKVIPEDTTVEQLKAYTIKDNAAYGEWDYDLLANEWDEVQLDDWCLDIPNTLIGDTDDESEEIKRMEDEFKRRMEAGENLEEDEEYLEFLEKYKAKKTTDDCYTPEIIYKTVANWVENEYHVNRKDFVRPFYPGGDYKAEKYPKGCVVVDNPPFSIISEIINFFNEKEIPFFLFAQTMTCFSPVSFYTAICCGAPITYENGAIVNTSFVTNLGDKSIRFQSAPDLYEQLLAADAENTGKQNKTLPKYVYPDNVVTAPFVAKLSKYGVNFAVSVSHSCRVSKLESQDEFGKTIFGKGFLISETAAAEKAAAEKAAAEKAAATRWKLSDKEHKIIEQLSKYDEP